MRFIRATLCCVALATVCGYRGDRESSPPRAFRVTGRLFVDDYLAANACVAFHPINKETSQGRCPVAMTKRDGSFELTTYAMHDGAPDGDYMVTVTWPDDALPVDECECVEPLQHDRLGGRYADPRKTSLAVTILPQDNYINLCAMGEKRTRFPGFAPARGRAIDKP